LLTRVESRPLAGIGAPGTDEVSRMAIIQAVSASQRSRTAR
jgi:hypothetical protein